MAIESIITVQVTKDGMIPIPAELSKELGLKPLQTVYLKKSEGHLLVMLSPQGIGKRIVALMQEGLAGLTQTDIDEARMTDR